MGFGQAIDSINLRTIASQAWLVHALMTLEQSALRMDLDDEYTNARSSSALTRATSCKQCTRRLRRRQAYLLVRVD